MRRSKKVEEHIADAVAKGAKVLLGGKRHALGGLFFEPTILADVTPAMKVTSEETFGPVAPLFRFKTEEEAIRMANDTEFGLASYFYARDLSRVWRVVGRARVRHRRHQHRPHLDRRGAVRRDEGVRARPRGLEVRDRRVPRDQVLVRCGLTGSLPATSDSRSLSARWSPSRRHSGLRCRARDTRLSDGSRGSALPGP